MQLYDASHTKNLILKNINQFLLTKSRRFVLDKQIKCLVVLHVNV